MDSFAIINENHKEGLGLENRQRKDKHSYGDSKQFSEEYQNHIADENGVGEDTKNVNSLLDDHSEVEKDVGKEHSYARAKSGRKRHKLSVNSMQYQKKQVKQANKKVKTALKQPDSLSVSVADVKKSFKCDKCGSSSVVNPILRGNCAKKGKYLPSPRRKVDPETNKILLLCNACGLAFGRTKKPKLTRMPPSLEEKQRYFDDGQQFAEHLATMLDINEASRLYCTRYTKTPCGCIQRYIGTDKSKDWKLRAVELLEIMKKAKSYKNIKVYENRDELNGDDSGDNVMTEKQKKSSKKNQIGLGNGQKKSKEFEKYVLEQREWLKKNLGFCETGTKRVLYYSNNFLHKKLKTEPEKSCRVTRQKGLAALGKLVAIEDLPTEQCCADNCVRMAVTHQTLLQQWRDRCMTGQSEARRVIAEMLTPSGGSRTNCYKFITSVTGCSLTTISKVNEQMKKTVELCASLLVRKRKLGGNREPPKHGLISYWKQHPKPKKDKVDARSTAKPNTSSSSFTRDTSPTIFPAVTFVQPHPPYGILQAAANSAGLAAVMQAQQQPQQLSQSITNNAQNNPTVITVPATLYPHLMVIPANAVPIQNFQIQHPVQQSQFQLVQPQSQQQQAPAAAIATPINQVHSLARQQVATPTMVTSSTTQLGACMLITSSSFMETDTCTIPSIITTPQQLLSVNTPQASINPIISLLPQSQTHHGTMNESISIYHPPSQSSTSSAASSDQYLSTEHVNIPSTIAVAATEGAAPTQVSVSQFAHLTHAQQSINQDIQQHQQQQVTFMSQT
eukprot:gene16111-17735_t